MINWTQASITTAQGMTDNILFKFVYGIISVVPSLQNGLIAFLRRPEGRSS